MPPNTKLKKDVKEKWVKALRSGEYQQAKGYLAYNGGYCCLGVLCEVAVKSGVELEVKEEEGTRKLYDGEMSGLPVAVREWAAYKRRPIGSDALVKVNDHTHRWLADLNDNGMSFNEIADLIEREL